MTTAPSSQAAVPAAAPACPVHLLAADTHGRAVLAQEAADGTIRLPVIGVTAEYEELPPIAALVAGQHDAIIWLATLAGVVQLVDGYVGMQQRDPARTWGPLALGIAQFGVLALVQFTS